MTHLPAQPDEALADAHRELFGRLVGWLFRRNGDLQAAEDAVATAFAQAITAWREGGVPRSPEAWLRVAARNAAISAARRRARDVLVAPEEMIDTAVTDAELTESAPTQDDVLTLLFVCAHPAIDDRMHAPLMLQAALGVDAARIAAVFLVPPSTMGQRLSRVKTKIRDAGIRYRVPTPEDLPTRVGAVLRAIYAAYGASDALIDELGGDRPALRTEALRLAEMVTALLPDDPEARGLLALLLHTESRRPARFVDGSFVPLGAQDTRLWSARLRARGDDELRRAAALGRLGRFQLEAAISAVHSARAETGTTDWQAVVALYRGLLQIAPSTGARIGAAAALVEVGEADAAARALAELPTSAVADHQPYWVCLARVEAARGRVAEAADATRRAVGLTTDPRVRAHLLRGSG
jgi:RNA polymerase sigma-70 factor (ECF subfamily)